MNIFTRRISQKREAIENIEDVDYNKKSVKRKSLPTEIFTVKEKDGILIKELLPLGTLMILHSTIKLSTWLGDTSNRFSNPAKYKMCLL